MKNAFLTGSQVYGKPEEFSDVDLVVRVDQETAQKLVELSDDESIPIRFGRLNLIVTIEDEQFEAWEEMTEEALDRSRSRRSPVLRDEAIELREAACERREIEPQPYIFK